MKSISVGTHSHFTVDLTWPQHFDQSTASDWPATTTWLCPISPTHCLGTTLMRIFIQRTSCQADSVHCSFPPTKKHTTTAKEHSRGCTEVDSIHIFQHPQRRSDTLDGTWFNKITSWLGSMNMPWGFFITWEPYVTQGYWHLTPAGVRSMHRVT